MAKDVQWLTVRAVGFVGFIRSETWEIEIGQVSGKNKCYILIFPGGINPFLILVRGWA